MNNQNWINVKKQLSGITKDLPTKVRSNINDDIYKKASSIMEQKSLSLIYDDFGVQMYEKTPNIKNYISCQKNGFDLSISYDESKLIKKNIELEDSFRTDFIPYGTLDNIEAKDVRENMKSDFIVSNDYLYANIKQEELKQKVFNDGIEEIKTWFNKKELKKIQEQNKQEKLIGFLQ